MHSKTFKGFKGPGHLGAVCPTLLKDIHHLLILGVGWDV